MTQVLKRRWKEQGQGTSTFQPRETSHQTRSIKTGLTWYWQMTRLPRRRLRSQTLYRIIAQRRQMSGLRQQLPVQARGPVHCDTGSRSEHDIGRRAGRRRRQRSSTGDSGDSDTRRRRRGERTPEPEPTKTMPQGSTHDGYIDLLRRVNRR